MTAKTSSFLRSFFHSTSLYIQNHPWQISMVAIAVFAYIYQHMQVQQYRVLLLSSQSNTTPLEDASLPKKIQALEERLGELQKSISALEQKWPMSASNSDPGFSQDLRKVALPFSESSASLQESFAGLQRQLEEKMTSLHMDLESGLNQKVSAVVLSEFQGYSERLSEVEKQLTQFVNQSELKTALQEEVETLRQELVTRVFLEAQLKVLQETIASLEKENTSKKAMEEQVTKMHSEFEAKWQLELGQAITAFKEEVESNQKQGEEKQVSLEANLTTLQKKLSQLYAQFLVSGESVPTTSSSPASMGGSSSRSSITSGGSKGYVVGMKREDKKNNP